MFLSPPEIQQVLPKSRLGRYDREEIDELLEYIVASYERVWRERDEGRARIAELQRELRDYEELERALRDSLVTGQRAAREVKDEAAREAEALIEEATRKAGEIVVQAERERDDISAEIERLNGVEEDVRARCRTLLVGALDAIGADGPVPSDSEAAAATEEVAATR